MLVWLGFSFLVVWSNNNPCGALNLFFFFFFRCDGHLNQERLTLHYVGGPHQLLTAVGEKAECSQRGRNSAFHTALDTKLHQLLPEFPGCQPSLQILDLPGATIMWANSLKEISFCILVLFLWRTLIHHPLLTKLKWKASLHYYFLWF